MNKELKIRIKSPMVSIRNGLIAETHSVFPQGETNETTNYGIRKIANNINCIISPTSILGWLRSGMTEYLISQGISVCHSYDLNLPSKDYRRYVIQDIEHGYHRKVIASGENKGKPECEATFGKKCLVGEMFGNFTGNHRVFSLMPVKTSPVDSQYTKGIKNITGKGNFLNTSISPRSAVDGTPFATHEMNSISNLDAILYIKMYEPNPRMDIHIAMLLRAFDYLNIQKDNYNHQLGGNRTFGCGFVDNTVLPSDLERDEVVKYHSTLIKIEDRADESDGLNNTIKEKINLWEIQKKKYDEILNSELKTQKEIFGIDKKWWKVE